MQHCAEVTDCNTGRVSVSFRIHRTVVTLITTLKPASGFIQPSSSARVDIKMFDLSSYSSVSLTVTRVCSVTVNSSACMNWIHFFCSGSSSGIIQTRMIIYLYLLMWFLLELFPETCRHRPTRVFIIIIIIMFIFISVLLYKRSVL